jgi:hypothetical protein
MSFPQAVGPTNTPYAEPGETWQVSAEHSRWTPDPTGTQPMLWFLS